MSKAIAAMLTVLTVLGGCGGDGPVPIEKGTACAFCRMTISDPRLAAEIVAPGEEPRVYDDIGCLANDLRQRPAPAAARAFVADFSTGTLIPAAEAVYTRDESIATPMSSHVVAHATTAARDADGRIRSGTPVSAADVFGRTLPGGSDGK
jgi:copper chaperone NosL